MANPITFQLETSNNTTQPYIVRVHDVGGSSARQLAYSETYVSKAGGRNVANVVRTSEAAIVSGRTAAGSSSQPTRAWEHTFARLAPPCSTEQMKTSLDRRTADRITLGSQSLGLDGLAPLLETTP